MQASCTFKAIAFIDSNQNKVTKLTWVLCFLCAFQGQCRTRLSAPQRAYTVQVEPYKNISLNVELDSRHVTTSTPITCSMGDMYALVFFLQLTEISDLLLEILLQFSEVFRQLFELASRYDVTVIRNHLS